MKQIHLRIGNTRNRFLRSSTLTTPHWGSCRFSYQKRVWPRPSDRSFLVGNTWDRVHPIVLPTSETPDFRDYQSSTSITPHWGSRNPSHRKCKWLVCSELLTEITPALGKLSVIIRHSHGDWPFDTDARENATVCETGQDVRVWDLEVVIRTLRRWSWTRKLAATKALFLPIMRTIAHFCKPLSLFNSPWRKPCNEFLWQCLLLVQKRLSLSLSLSLSLIDSSKS